LALTPGTRLGVYEVVAAIGEGGMGQVFRARDTRLNRDVALKVLPDSFANDPDRLARFTREAQTLASLNHPNIAHIHGLEESDGMRALVMELVDGEDLSQRIARGAIPIEEALPIAKQIAEALEAAHEQGVIHRDLKPANIKLRADGTVKVLDFGLAKAMEPPAGSSPSVSTSPTITTPAMTHAGMILGTAAYMSPEQARGKTVDKRADIWAFGAVLFEMLTGSQPFPGEDISHVLARVIERDPEWSALPPALPSALGTYLRRCLVKDPRQRVRDIGDVRLALEGVFETVVPHAIAFEPKPTAAARVLPWAVAGTFAVVAMLLWAPWRTQTPVVDRPLVRLDVDLGSEASLPAPGRASSVSISPDGTRLVYVSGTPSRLFMRRLDQPKATELPGTQGAAAPFFSPNGQWIGFISGIRVNKISVDGGAVVPVGSDTGLGARWGEDDNVFIAAKNLLRIRDGGGVRETVAELRGGELAMLSPEILPGGNAILFAVDHPGPVDKTTIEVVTLGDRQRKTVVQGGASPRYLATGNGTGHLLYVNQATLFAIRFDLDTLTTRGTPVPVVDDVAHETQGGVGQFEVSRTGTLVYRRALGGASSLTTLQWVDATARKEPLPARPGAYQDLSLSPDGTQVALVVMDGGSEDIWVYDIHRDTMTRLTFGGALDRFPRWSPDGRLVIFSSIGNGIFEARADGASQPHELMPSNVLRSVGSFTPDGKRFVYTEAPNSGIWTVPVGDAGGHLKAGTPELFLKSTVTDLLPSFSPDGRWLAYQSNESGTNEIYVRAFPPPTSGPGSKWQISNNGGTYPRWVPTGHDLLYQSGDQILAASYAVKGDTFVAEKPRVWIARLGGTQSRLGGTQWDLAPDGKRVMVLMPVGSADGPTQEHEVVFLQNFFDELRRRVPLGK
jgi:serine/threonine-protein kinase